MKWTRDTLEPVLASLPEPFKRIDACRYAVKTWGNWSLGQGVVLSAERLGMVFPTRIRTRNKTGTYRVLITYSRVAPYSDRDVAEAQALMGRLGTR